jgi:hypothetical protein
MIQCKTKVIGAGNTVTAIFLMAGPYFLKEVAYSTTIILDNDVPADKDSTEEKPHTEKAKRMKLFEQNLGDRFMIVAGREVQAP